MGVFLGFFGIVGLLWGGHLYLGGGFLDFIQPVALFGVFFGCLFSLLAAVSLKEFKEGALALLDLFISEDQGLRALASEIAALADLSRKEGLLALEAKRTQLSHEYFKKALKFVIDGLDPAAVREWVDAEAQKAKRQREKTVELYEAGATYAPVMGIVFAVVAFSLGMLQLAEQVQLISSLRFAFSSVLYGFLMGSFFFSPVASRLRRRMEFQSREHQCIRLGLGAIQEGLSPQFLKERLESVTQDSSERQGFAS